MSEPTIQDGPAAGGMLAQILLKQGEMGTQLAVMNTKLDAIPDHETRIRVLESSKAKMVGAATVLGALSGSGAGAIITWALSRH